MSAGTGAVLAGRYRLGERIGRGGMAEVYRGHDDLLDRQIAVKVFRAETVDAGDTAGRRRVETEMRTLAGLHHPGLVTLYDASPGDDASGHAPFLVMEYVAGPTLTQRLARGPLSPGEVAALGAELAAALEHVHARGIVHRDVKPANILLDEAGGRFRPKLTDFGIARIVDGTRLTADGWTIGTANYLSPEQARGAAVGPPSDIYALGLVLIECLTGAVAFPGTGLESAVARLSRPPAVPTHFGPGWTSLLSAMTATDPAARPDAATVAAALAPAADAAGSQPTAPLSGAGWQPTAPLAAAALPGAALPPAAAAGTATSVLPADRRRRRRLALAAGSLALVAALVAVLAVALASGAGGNSGGRQPGATKHTRSAGSSTPPSTTRTPTSTSTAPSTSTSASSARPAPKPAPPPARKPAPKPHHGGDHAPGHKPGHGHGHGDG